MIFCAPWTWCIISRPAPLRRLSGVRTQHLGRVGRKLGDISDAKRRKREGGSARSSWSLSASLPLSLSPNGEPTGGERGERSNNHHAISGTVVSASVVVLCQTFSWHIDCNVRSNSVLPQVLPNLSTAPRPL